MLGLLQRLHCIHIRYSLESESEITDIKYPHIDVHKKKDGYCKLSISNFQLLSNQEICRANNLAKEKARNAIESLGMHKSLKENKFHDPPLPNTSEKSEEKRNSHDDCDNDENEEQDDATDEDEAVERDLDSVLQHVAEMTENIS